jgi:hypothetical protein
MNKRDNAIPHHRHLFNPSGEVMPWSKKGMEQMLL